MRRKLAWLAAGFALILSATACGGVSDAERDRAVALAGTAYEEALASGVNLEDGPCIADPLESLSDWVVDIAHDPRRDVDDDPANQCESYRSGEAEHFVELAPNGSLIRAK